MSEQNIVLDYDIWSAKRHINGLKDDIIHLNEEIEKTLAHIKFLETLKEEG